MCHRGHGVLRCCLCEPTARAGLPLCGECVCPVWTSPVPVFWFRSALPAAPSLFLPVRRVVGPGFPRSGLVCWSVCPLRGVGGGELGAVDTLGPWGDSPAPAAQREGFPPLPPWPGLGAHTSAPWRYSAAPGVTGFRTIVSSQGQLGCMGCSRGRPGSVPPSSWRPCCPAKAPVPLGCRGPSSH